MTPPRPQDAAAPTTRAPPGWRAYPGALIALVLGLALSVLAFVGLRAWEQDRSELAFTKATEGMAASIEQCIHHQADSVYAVAAFVDSFPGELSQGDFLRLTRPLLAHCEALLAFQWIPRVTQEERAAFEARAQRELPGFRIASRTTSGEIVPAETRAEYLPIRYVAPLAERKRAIGCDINSDPERRVAAEQARDTGKTVIASHVPCFHDPRRQSAAVVFHPIYSTDGVPPTLAARRQSLRGFVGSSFAVDRLIEHVAERAGDAQVDVALYAATVRGGRTLVYFRPAPDGGGRVAPTEHSEARYLESAFEVGDQRWVVAFAAAPAGYSAVYAWLPWGGLGGGLALTLLLALQLGTARAHTLRIEREVLERTAAEAQARRQRDFFDAVLDTSGALTVVLDREGHIVRFNRACEAFSGYAFEEVEGRWLWDLFLTPEDAELIQNLFRAAASGTLDDYRHENWWITRDGGRRLVHWSSTVLRDGAGGLEYVIGTGLDITERKRLEEALRVNEERLRLAAQAAGFGTYDFNFERNELFWSPEVNAMFGLPVDAPAELDAEHIIKAVHPDDRERLRRLVHASLDPDGPGEFESEHRIVRPDGTVRWMLVKGKTFFAGEGRNRRVVRAVGAGLDVTERRQAEQELRRLADELELERARFEAVLHQMPAGLAVIEATSGHIVLTNEQGVAIWGRRPQSVDDILIGDARLYRPDGRPYARDEWPIVRSLRTGEVVVNEEMEYQRADGRRVTFLGSTSPVRDRAGRIVAAVVLLHDITERKRMEQALRAQTEQLAEADRRKDEFLAVLAHELRNPLAPISNAVEVLKRRTGPPDPMVTWAEEVIGRQAGQLTKLVNDLLDVARITRGRIELRKEPVELAGIVGDAVDTVRPVIEARRHELTVTLPPEPVTLEADAARLVQILGNLLDNAAKYTPEGGHIELGVAREGREAVIRVRDDGIGIAPETLPQIFEPFTRIERAPGVTRGGLGLGLSVTRRLVEMHGGSIRAESAGPGQGSLFTVRLPLAERAVHPRAEPGAAESTAAEPRRILVVEDNPDVAESLALLLRALGHEVRVAPDGASGLEAARRFQPQVAFLDIGLPDIDGYEVARRLRATQPPALRLVALTGYGQEEDRRRAREAGFDRHVLKPARVEELEGVLEALPCAASG